MMFDYPSWGLFLSAFLSSTLLPGGSEAVLAYLTRAQGHELWWLLGVASVGNTLGGMTSWLFGRIIAIRYPAEQVITSEKAPATNTSDAGRGESKEAVYDHPSLTLPLQERENPQLRRSGFPLSRRGSRNADQHRRSIEYLRRWGAPVLLLSWLPVIGDPLCVAAGWLRVHWLLSLILIGIGKTVRYAVVVFLFM